ncbi:hypothetical protein AAVH_42212, partial [Aphelenchoides avenae]
NFFPEPIRVVFLLKPEGVLQRALEVGYRNFTENDKFKEKNLALIHRDDPGPGNGYLIWGRQARMDPSLKSGL